MKPPARRPTAVHTDRAVRGVLPVTAHYIGVIEPVHAADLAARAAGHLKTVAGDVGDRLEKAGVAAMVDPEIPLLEKRARAEEIKGAEKALAISRKILERRKTLIRKGHVAEETLDQARRQYALDRARVRRLAQELAASRESLSHTRLAVPFDGIITRRMKDPGELVTVGTPILRLENPAAGYKVLARIPGKTASRLLPGNPVELLFDKKNRPAAVYRIHPAADAGSLAVLEVRCAKKPFGLPSGAVLGVSVTLERAEGILIPLDCLLEQADACRVFAVDEADRTARSIPVELLGKSGNRAAVQGPVQPGVRLVSGPESLLLQLSDKTPITPLPSEAAGRP